MLACQAAAAVAWERVRRGKLLLRCRLLGGARRFGAHGGRRGVRAYRSGRPPTACLIPILYRPVALFLRPIHHSAVAISYVRVTVMGQITVNFDCSFDSAYMHP